MRLEGRSVAGSTLLSGSAAGGFIHGKSHTGGSIHGKISRAIFSSGFVSQNFDLLLGCQPRAGLGLETRQAQAGSLGIKM